jgi:hypothetical protein
MYLNNGIYDVYKLDLIDNYLKNELKIDKVKQERMDYSNQLHQIVPTFEKLYEIIKLALKRKFVVRCCMEKSKHDLDARNDYFIVDFIDSSKHFKCFNYKLLYNKSKFRE